MTKRDSQEYKSSKNKYQISETASKTTPNLFLEECHEAPEPKYKINHKYESEI